jgi:hypothetical protein
VDEITVVVGQFVLCALFFIAGMIYGKMKAREVERNKYLELELQRKKKEAEKNRKSSEKDVWKKEPKKDK